VVNPICRRAWLLLLSSALTAVAAAAETRSESTSFDPARSHADFEVKVMWLIGLHGDFGAVQGNLTLDSATGLARVEAQIDTRALHMRSHSYENWAKSVEFFDAEHYPRIDFASAKFPPATLTGGGDLAGTLTIRGISRPVVLHVATPDCADPLHGGCPVEATALIRRSDFGMRSRRGALSDKVELDLSILVAAPAASAQ
jgi:polyisoprenoid-binding protein YceI